MSDINAIVQGLQNVHGFIGQLLQAAQQLQAAGTQPLQANVQQGLQFGGNTQPATNPAPVQQANQAAAATGGLSFGGAAPAQPAVSAAQVQELITQLAQHEPLKNAIIGEMGAMGIQNLGDTRPDQMNELYSRVQGVAARAQEIMAGQQQQAAAAPSLI